MAESDRKRPSNRDKVSDQLGSMPTSGSESPGGERPQSKPMSDTRTAQTDAPAVLSAGWPQVIDDRYEVRKMLGRGASGTVYLVWDRSSATNLALKQIDVYGANWEKRKKRFQREVDAIKRCKHPNIITVYDIRLDKGYFTMELIDGTTLDAYLEAHKPLPGKEAATMVKSIAAALDFAHSQGIVHRDIKAANILVDQAGKLYLTDFGIALVGGSERLTQEGLRMGTPNYMAPEQVNGERNISAQADIWALGILLYYLVTAKYPFTGSNKELYDRIVSKKPVPMQEWRDGVSNVLEKICARALEKKPEDRYGTANEMAQDLDCFLAKKPLLHATSFNKLARKSLYIGIACALMLLGVVTWLTLIDHRRPDAVKHGNSRPETPSPPPISPPQSKPDNLPAKVTEQAKALAQQAQGWLDKANALPAIWQENAAQLQERKSYLLRAAQTLEQAAKLDAQYYTQTDRTAAELALVIGISQLPGLTTEQSLSGKKRSAAAIAKSFEMAERLAAGNSDFLSILGDYGFCAIEEKFEVASNEVVATIKQESSRNNLNAADKLRINDFKSELENLCSERRRHLDTAITFFTSWKADKPGPERSRLVRLGHLYLRQGILISRAAYGEEFGKMKDCFYKAVAAYNEAIASLGNSDPSGESVGILFNKSFVFEHLGVILYRYKVATDEVLENFDNATLTQRQACLAAANAKMTTHRDHWNNLERFAAHKQQVNSALAESTLLTAIAKIAQEVLAINAQDLEAQRIFGKYRPYLAAEVIPK